MSMRSLISARECQNYLFFKLDNVKRSLISVRQCLNDLSFKWENVKTIFYFSGRTSKEIFYVRVECPNNLLFLRAYVNKIFYFSGKMPRRTCI
jgi:hypothetical protein